MSEEELSEGSLDLRARGSSRATSHGQVLIRESDNDGGREVPEEEGLEEEEVCEALLQLLERDLLACDVQLSLFVAAATSYRQVCLIMCELSVSDYLFLGHNAAPLPTLLSHQHWGEGCGGSAGCSRHLVKSRRCEEGLERRVSHTSRQASATSALGIRRWLEVEIPEQN